MNPQVMPERDGIFGYPFAPATDGAFCRLALIIRSSTKDGSRLGLRGVRAAATLSLEFQAAIRNQTLNPNGAKDEPSDDFRIYCRRFCRCLVLVWAGLRWSCGYSQACTGRERDGERGWLAPPPLVAEQRLRHRSRCADHVGSHERREQLCRRSVHDRAEDSPGRLGPCTLRQSSGAAPLLASRRIADLRPSADEKPRSSFMCCRIARRGEVLHWR